MKQACPICHQNAFHSVWSFGTLDSGCCVACGHVYSQSDRPVSYTGFGQSYAARDLMGNDRPLSILARNRLGVVSQYLPLRDKQVLEVGCGYGHFLSLLQDAGARVTGYEPGAKGAEFARNHLGLVNIYNKSFDPEAEQAAMTFDLIAAFHMLEHTEQPDAYVRAWASALKPCGILALAVPNLYTLHRDLHELYFIARGWHRHTFSPHVLHGVLERAGLQVLYADEEPSTSMSPSSYLLIATKDSRGSRVSQPCTGPDPCATLKSFHADLEQLCRNVANWVAIQVRQNRTIGVFGAGHHTTALFALCPFEVDQIHCVLDDDPDKWGKHINGVEIVGSHSAAALACDAILVSSLAAETTLLERLRQQRPDAEIVGIYSDLTNGLNRAK